MKITVKIAVIAMMGISLSINGQWKSDGNNSSTGSLKIGGDIDATGHNKRLFLGGSGKSTFGLAYDSKYPNYGIFYTEDSPDFVSISPNGDSKNGVMNIFGNGNVGIGTDTVEGNLQIGSGTTNGLITLGGGKGYSSIGSTRSDGALVLGKNIYTRYEGTDDNYIARVGKSGSVGFSGLKLGRNGQIDFFGKNGNVSSDQIANTNENIRLRIDPKGNIGIGTTSPNATLDIKGDFKIGNGSTYTDLVFRTGTAISGVNGVFEILPKTMPGSGTAKHTTYFKNASHTNGKTEHNLVVDGNIGIGTTSPNATLQVGDSDHTGTPSQEVEKKRLSIAPVTHFGSDWFFTSRDNTYANLDIGYGSRKSVTLRHDGNVGIGTTKPDMKLTVKGKIHAEEVKIDLKVPAPDYVFKSDYTLRSIEEVESFIKEHSHLPEIPSAKEFAENGVMQAEMDMNLLKKIEELTLYTIKQQKEINSQKIEIEKLKKQNSKIKDLEVLVQKLLKDKK